MSSSQLANYIRSNRKRLALSQDDMTFLIGLKSEATMSRFESFDRVPTLEAALACEVIFKRSVSELFGGLYQKAEREVAERAKALAQRKRRGRERAPRKQALAELAAINRETV